jgi:hypothetical protein
LSQNSYLNIHEQDYVMGEMSEDEERIVAARNLVIYENDSRFWGPNLELGRTCFDYVQGEIFTSGEKSNYKKKEKILVTNPELVPKLNALEAMQIAGRRAGIVVPEGAEDSPDVEVINRLLLSLKSASNFQQESTNTFVDGMIASYPVWMWFDRPSQSGNDWNSKRVIDMYHPPWDSIVPDPNFKAQDYKDGQRLTRLILFDKDQLMRSYPKRAKEIDAKINLPQFEAGSFGTTLFTSAQRDILFNKAKTASQTYEQTGQILVIERNHFVFTEAEVWFSPESNKPQILPEEWDDKEVEEWKRMNPSFKMVKREVRILFVTACTSTGMLLENARHWFQENEFPGECYIPKMLNNRPHGIVEYLRGALKAKNVARIEHLHSLRLANDNIIKVKAGSVENAKELPHEISKAGGIVVIGEDKEMQDVEFVQQRREQVAWRDASNDFQEDMDRLFLDRNVEGGAQSSQESGKAIDKRIQAGQMKQSPYLDSYNTFDLRCTRKALKMVPYRMTGYHIMRYVKEDDSTGTDEFNKPQKFDWATGAVVKVKNNLAGAKYDYREAHGDNSVTGKEFELKVFTEVLNKILPSMPDPSLWPMLLNTIPNRLCNEFGRQIEKQMEDSKDDGPEPPKLSFSFTGEDLLYNPIAQSVLQQAGYGQSPGVQQPPGGSGAPPPDAGKTPNQTAQPSQV